MFKTDICVHYFKLFISSGTHTIMFLLHFVDHFEKDVDFSTSLNLILRGHTMFNNSEEIASLDYLELF